MFTACIRSECLRFLEVKGSNFKFHLFNPQKSLLWPVRRIMTYCEWGCVERWDLCPRRRSQKDTNFYAWNWLFARTIHVDIAPWKFACRVMSVNQLWISSFMKSVERSRSFGVLLAFKPWYINMCIYRVSQKWPPMPFCQNCYNQWHFTAKFYTHTFTLQRYTCWPFLMFNFKVYRVW